MLAELISHIGRYVTLDEDQKGLLSEYLEVKTFKRRQMLLEEGEVCKSDYFVLKGCVRSYFYNEKGTEQTLQFAIENWWISDYQSYISNEKSLLSIQAIERTTVVVWKKEDENFLFENIPQLERYFRIIYQKVYAASIMRVRYLYEYSRENLYREFATNFPEFVQRVPNYMLASYLGFTPEYLSELRRRIVS